MKSKLLMAFSVILALIMLTGCTAGSKDDELKMASVNDMPAEVKAAPVSVRDAYQFAVANPQVLQEIPCYCGCGPIGHTSNYDCYVSSQDSSGEISFDFHSLGCSICVDITQDTMRLLKDGKSTPEIKSYIDGAYARYGPTNMP